jgi:hypothetical protein
MSQIVISPAQPNQLAIEEELSTVIVELPTTAIATIVAAGPQGPPGPTGGGVIVNDAAKVDKSVIYYDASTASFKADAIWTILSLTDGGNF